MSNEPTGFTPNALAPLDAHIAALERDLNYSTKTYAGRFTAWETAIKAGMEVPQFRDALIPSGPWAIPSGPWVVFTCPYGHKIGPVRFQLDPDSDVTGVPIGDLIAGKALLKHLTNDELIGSQNNMFINNRRRWHCPLKSCKWKGDAYRPEHILKMYVLAHALGVRHAPVELR